MMKNINIYLATADESKVELLEIADLIVHLNKVFNPRDINLRLVPHNEEMGNLEDCELCLALYHTKLDHYGKDDFADTYESLKHGKKPRKLYVFFKNSDEMDESQTQELKDFKESFATNYGHFFCKFENVDTLKLNFILQLEAYQNSHATDNLLKVEEQKIYVGDFNAVNLNNIPFAKLNTDYVRMRDELISLEEEIESLRNKIKKYPNDNSFAITLDKKLAKRTNLSDIFEQHQSALFNTALRIAKITDGRISERLQRAITSFENGKASEANAILSEAEHDADIFIANFRKYKKLTEQVKENIVISIEELKLKTQTAIIDENKTLEARVIHVKSIFEKALELAKAIEYEPPKYALLITDFANFLYLYEKYERATEIYEKVIPLLIELYGNESEELKLSYSNICDACIKSGNSEKTKQYKVAMQSISQK